MIPVYYSNIRDWEDMDLWLSGADPEGEPSVHGEFTSLRVDRNTLPEGMYAYDLRDADGDSELWFSELKEHVLVNHAGTFVTTEKIEGAEDGLEISDYSFY